MATNIADVITEKLKAKQDESGLSDAAFAEKIGISRQLWAFVKTGKREPGMTLLSAVMNIFPDLTLEVMEYMKAKGQSVKE